jgi:hypothetical protein
MTHASRDFNRPYRKQEHCIAVNVGLRSDPPVLYADGEPVGDGYVVPRKPSWNPNSTVHSSCADKPGSIRIDLTEAFAPDSSDGATLYFHKGGQGYLPGTVPYGHLHESALSSPLPEPRFTREEIDRHGAEPRNRDNVGAGRAMPRTIGAFSVQPLSIGSDDPADPPWLYKDPSEYPGESLSGARYGKYGDAGGTQGARDQHFAYLCWSWMRQDGMEGDKRLEVGGGGAVRTLLRRDQVVERCDVRAISNSAWDRDGNVVGRVRAVYVRVPVPGVNLYGWVVHSHAPRVNQGWGDWVPHLERLD